METRGENLTGDAENLKLHPYVKIIRPTWIEWFKKDVKAILGQIESLQEGQYESIKTLRNLKGICEDLSKYVADLILKMSSHI